MDRLTVCTGHKTYHGKGVNPPQIDLWIECNSCQYSSKNFEDIDKIILTFTWKGTDLEHILTQKLQWEE
jgi:hypothetical protein